MYDVKEWAKEKLRVTGDSSAKQTVLQSQPHMEGDGDTPTTVQ